MVLVDQKRRDFEVQDVLWNAGTSRKVSLLEPEELVFIRRRKNTSLL